ncbi:hypothetical protein EXS70_01040 [Candidatus Peribacteria bacterium]|nr:hypothetical protein [Candidatus Peribacteria bacterium]
MKVLIFGTFDHFHPGHSFVITEAMKRGDVSVVIARDRNVERIKGNSSAQSEQERAHVVAETFPDIRVVLGDPKDFLTPVRSIQPDLILLGYDQKMPPGVSESDLPCAVERLPAFKSDEFKSSLRRQK